VCRSRVVRDNTGRCHCRGLVAYKFVLFIYAKSLNLNFYITVFEDIKANVIQKGRALYTEFNMFNVPSYPPPPHLCSRPVSCTLFRFVRLAIRKFFSLVFLLVIIFDFFFNLFISSWYPPVSLSLIVY
jgi:hypothetical protein